MSDDQKVLAVVFYRTGAGIEPVREWLLTLPPEDRRTIGIDLMRVEFGWPIGMPVCRSLGQGLWEVRSSLSSERIARVLFCIAEGQMYLLTGFMKSTQKTPHDELTLARKRQLKVLRND